MLTINTHQMAVILAEAEGQNRALEAQTDCGCLFFGRGGVFPGLKDLVIERYGQILLLIFYNHFSDTDRKLLRAALMEKFSFVKTIIEQNRSGGAKITQATYGTPVTGAVPVRERGLSFWADLGRYQNTGLFLDMQSGRSRTFEILQKCSGPTVLNLFAYTCSFSVVALAAGAEHVVNVDLSSNVLSRGRENHRLNRQDTGKIDFLPHNILKSFGKIEKKGPYSFIVVDPPALQKGAFLIDRDYPKILKRLKRWLAPGGYLMACLNSVRHSRNDLLDLVQQSAPELEFMEWGTLPSAYKDVNPEQGLKIAFFHYR